MPQSIWNLIDWDSDGFDYHGTKIPALEFTVGLQGTRHLLNICGDQLTCRTHGNPLMQALNLGGEPIVCQQLEEKWPEIFSDWRMIGRITSDHQHLFGNAKLKFVAQTLVYTMRQRLAGLLKKEDFYNDYDSLTGQRLVTGPLVDITEAKAIVNTGYALRDWRLLTYVNCLEVGRTPGLINNDGELNENVRTLIQYNLDSFATIWEQIKRIQPQVNILGFLKSLGHQPGMALGAISSLGDDVEGWRKMLRTYNLVALRSHQSLVHGKRDINSDEQAIFESLGAEFSPDTIAAAIVNTVSPYSIYYIKRSAQLIEEHPELTPSMTIWYSSVFGDKPWQLRDNAISLDKPPGRVVLPYESSGRYAKVEAIPYDWVKYKPKTTDLSIER